MPLPTSAIPAQPREGEPADAIHQSAETLALMARRRSTKVAHLAEPGPSSAEIDALIELATRVPDHGKIGPWRFVVIDGAARERAGEAVAKVVEHDEGADESRGAWARNMFKRAPTVVMVVSSTVQSPKVPAWEQLLSSGAVCFALLMASHAMGYAGCWLTEWPSYDARVRTALGLAEHERIAGLVYLGTSREPVTERVRADAASRISRF